MAKKDKNKPNLQPNLAWRYKLKKQFETHSQRSEWLKCSEADKVKIIKMFPNRYDWEELEKIEPTANMIVEE
jgi:hypothetical protein